jgi:hypothetical protein
MFPIKRIEQLHQELHQYYYKLLLFNKDSQYLFNIPKLARTMSKLENIIEDMRNTITIEMII